MKISDVLYGVGDGILYVLSSYSPRAREEFRKGKELHGSVTKGLLGLFQIVQNCLKNL